MIEMRILSVEAERAERLCLRKQGEKWLRGYETVEDNEE